jgi:hypothetical protein
VEKKMKNLIQKIGTCESNNATIAIGNALLWAAVMLATAWLTRGSEHAESIFLVLLCASTTSLLLIDRYQKQ